MPIYTHDRVDFDNATGIFDPTKGGNSRGNMQPIFGGHALQTIQITRNTPITPVQAIGFLGIVDYTTATQSSDVSLDVVLVEGVNNASGYPTNILGNADVISGTETDYGVYKHAQSSVAIGNEEYLLTSVSIGFTAGSPATMSLGYITPSIASEIATKAAIDDPEDGEESRYAVVMGDDGNGCEVKGVFDGGSVDARTFARIDNDGNIVEHGSDFPAGIQSLNFSSNINRDQVLDIRASIPQQYVTTYPIDITIDMEIYERPTASNVSIMNKLIELWVESSDLAKHQSGTTWLDAAAGSKYAWANGLRLQSETEGLQVGQYITYSASYTASDMRIPLKYRDPV